MNFSYRDLIGRLMAAGGLLLCAAPLAAGSVLYVDDDAEPGGDGQSWETAYRFLRDALAAAQPPGVPGAGGGVEEIHVAQGLYLPDHDENHPEGNGDPWETFALIDGVAVMGGYAGIGTEDPDERNIELYETILSGDLLGNDLPDFVNYIDNSFHVVTASGNDDTALLEGFTITAGYAHFEPYGHHQGGGMLVDAASPIVRQCLFIWNLTAGSDAAGGGLCNRGGGHVVVDQCTFLENKSLEIGGGMAHLDSDATITDCSFESNLALDEYDGDGGAVYLWGGTADITGCFFRANVAGAGANALSSWYGLHTITDCVFEQHDGWPMGEYALYAHGQQYSSRLIRCLFIDNDCSAVHMNQSRLAAIDCQFIGTTTSAVRVCRSGPTFIGCSFLGNTTSYDGGAIHAYHEDTFLTLINCLFSGNEADDEGGALYLREESAASVKNCSFTNNLAVAGGAIYLSSSGGPTSLSASNCILWGNSLGQVYVGDECEAHVQYSCIQGPWEGPGNINANPLFVDAEGADGVPGTEDDDLHLGPGSPCIDAGNNFDVPPDDFDLDEDGDTNEFLPFDFGHEPRFVDDPDTEDTGNGPPPIVDMGAYEYQADSCPADFDGDGDVDTADLLFLLGAWGTPDGDVDGDGDTDTADLLALLGAWGLCR